MAAQQKLDVPSTVFDDMAKKYKNGLGGASVDIVQGMLARATAECSITSDSVIHDNACGPAIVTSEILNLGLSPQPQIFATDYAQGMVDISNGYKRTKSWDTVTVELMDGQALTYDDNKFTHSMSSLGLHMFPDEKKGLAEMYRTLKPGGWIATSSFKDVRWPPAAKAAYAKLFPDAKEPMQLPSAKSWETVESCEAMLKNAGFKDVKAEVVPCYNRQPDTKTGADVMTGFLRIVSPTAKAWDDATWEKFCGYFLEFWGPLFEPHPDGGLVVKLESIVATGKK